MNCCRRTGRTPGCTGRRWKWRKVTPFKPLAAQGWGTVSRPCPHRFFGRDDTMNTLAVSLFSLLALFLAATARAEAPAKVVLAIHGGAGPLPKKQTTPEVEKQYRADLEKALHAGYQV